MSPVASPAGADRAPAFTRTAAARIVGLAPSELRRWERALSAEGGFDLGRALTLADVLALAVLRVAVRRVRAEEFAFGFARLFELLRSGPDVERLDGRVALVGRDFARLVELHGDYVRCAGDDFLVVPLRPVLAELRDRAFA